MIRHREESEEQVIDRLLREFGIRLPKVDLAGEDPLEPAPDIDAGEIMLPEELSERRSAPFS